MVEGPEYRRHAELLQLLVGRRLLRVLRARPQLRAQLAELLGLRVLRVFSVGKEWWWLVAGGSGESHSFSWSTGSLVSASEFGEQELFAVFESRKQIEVEDEARP